MKRLTIAIPTFNRNEKAAAQAKAIIQQIDESKDGDIELLIIDNASDIPVKTTLAQAGMIERPGLQVIRNPVNVGLSGNILRCFEHAQGEWVWLVGDDDELLPDAVQQVWKVLGTGRETVSHHKFSVERNQEDTSDDLRIGTLAELCEHASNPWFFSNLLFITTSIYRREDFLPYISTAYHWNAAVAPHLVCLFCALRDGKTATVHANKIARVVPAEGAERWNPIRLRMGLQTLAEIEGCEKELHRLFGNLMRSWHGGWKFPLISVLLCLRSNRPLSFWRRWYFRAAASTDFWHSLVQASLALFWAPIGCSKLVRSLVQRRQGSRNDTAGLSRM